jgi:integrase
MGKWLTDSIVRDLRLPEHGVRRVYDAPDPRGKMGWTSGFGVRVSAGGSKSFVLRYRSRKTRAEHLYTIGSFPDWSVAAARSEARELRLKIERDDHDPQVERQQGRDAPTVATLCDRFLAEHVSGKRLNTKRDYTGIVEKIIRPKLGRKLVAAVTTKDVEDLHGEVTLRAPHRANRAVAVASKMFTLAIKWGLRPDNPCKGIKRNAEEQRERYLNGDELARLTRALGEHSDQQAADIIRLCMLTGCRRGEAQAARWNQFDFERGMWTKPSAATKQNKPHRAALSKPALALLAELRRKRDEKSPFVFPGRLGPDTHRVEMKKNWAAICKAARITGCRMHDLRHTYASFLASAGYSLPLIGALLGHTNPSTTARYSHLFPDVQREATNRVGALMTGLVAKRPAKGKLKVVGGGR